MLAASQWHVVLVALSNCLPRGKNLAMAWIYLVVTTKSYVDIMSHWEAVLPGAILRVQHEDVLDDLELQVRRILEYCDLPFEQQCLEFHKTERAVRTPSSEQVRQPIYKMRCSNGNIMNRICRN